MHSQFFRLFSKFWPFLKLWTFFDFIVKIFDLFFMHEFSKCLNFFKFVDLFSLIFKIFDLRLCVNSQNLWPSFTIVDLFALIVHILYLFFTCQLSKLFWKKNFGPFSIFFTFLHINVRIFDLLFMCEFIKSWTFYAWIFQNYGPHFQDCRSLHVNFQNLDLLPIILDL